MTDDPVSEMVDDQPTPAVIRTASGSAADYNPRVKDTGTGFQTTPVVGFFSGEMADDEDFEATLLLKAADKPSHLKAGASRCICGGVDYQVAEVRTRRWEGQINGYLLGLKQ